MRSQLASAITTLLLVSLASTQEAKPLAPGPAPVSFLLGGRHGHVSPQRVGHTHTGGGNVDVAQPSPDAIQVTMTSVAVAGGHPCKDSLAGMTFELEQAFEISFDNPKVKRARLSIEARVTGLLRSQAGHCKCGGAVEQAPASAVVSCGPTQVLALTVPPHSVACGESLSLNCREGPYAAPVAAGPYCLRVAFSITASHPRSVLPCGPASAEFAPDPALDPLWISAREPFHGASKKDFGFQVIMRLVPDEANGEAPSEGKWSRLEPAAGQYRLPPLANASGRAALPSRRDGSGEPPYLGCLAAGELLSRKIAFPSSRIRGSARITSAIFSSVSSPARKA
jgi:hypothetical protein